MKFKTLLLNTTYEPLSLIDWKKAITLVYLGKSEVLEEYDRHIKTVSHAVKVPSVLRLNEKIPTKFIYNVKFSRPNVSLRDQYTCQYCGKIFKALDLTYDHVTPKSKGGPTSWNNIVTCCIPCNRKKDNLTLEQAHMVLIKKPVKPRYLPLTKKQDMVSSWEKYIQSSNWLGTMF